MKSQQRQPSKNSVLQQIRDMEIPVKSVIDVGIHFQTRELMAAFPTQKHYLFEPVADHYDKIEQNYRDAGIDYDLNKVAVSNQDGFADLAVSSIRGTDEVTHSSLTGADSRDQEIRRVPTLKLDTFVAEHMPAAPYLIKIDVDGAEEMVLQGAPKALEDCSILIIEAAVSAVSTRIEMAVAAGFVLLDIVDICYNQGCLWQVDLVFINPKLGTEDWRRATQIVEPDNWCSLRLVRHSRDGFWKRKRYQLRKKLRG